MPPASVVRSIRAAGHRPPHLGWWRGGPRRTDVGREHFDLSSSASGRPRRSAGAVRMLVDLRRRRYDVVAVAQPRLDRSRARGLLLGLAHIVAGRSVVRLSASHAGSRARSPGAPPPSIARAGLCCRLDRSRLRSSPSERYGHPAGLRCRRARRDRSRRRRRHLPPHRHQPLAPASGCGWLAVAHHRCRARDRAERVRPPVLDDDAGRRHRAGHSAAVAAQLPPRQRADRGPRVRLGPPTGSRPPRKATRRHEPRVPALQPE